MANSYSQKRIRKIVRRFGLIPLRSEPVASFYRKNAIIRVQTNSGTYAMKPFYRSLLLRSGTIEQIETTAGYIQFLMSNGFSNMPKWLNSNDGRPWILNQGRPFYITAWIHGRKLENPEDFEKLGRALFSLHSTSSRFFSMNSPFFDHIRLWKNRDRLLRSRMAIANQTNLRIRRWLKRFGESCIQFSDRTWTELKTPEMANLLKREMVHPALIHNDITAHNVIISNDGQLFIIDWDHMKLGSIYVDLATTLMNTTQFNPVFMHSLLRGYEELRPLNRVERKLISALYRLPREAWHIAWFPNRPRSRNMLDIMEQTWLLRLRGMDVLDEWVNSGPN